MARIRFAHNSFSTGLISKKVQGNTEFEGYNNALDECVNFQVMHTGGVIKRGGTVFVSNTRYPDKQIKLFPFVYSALESYMCEFGDLNPNDMHTGIKNTPVSDASSEAWGYPKGLKYNGDGHVVDASNALMERGYIRFHLPSGDSRCLELLVPFNMEDLKTGSILQEGNLINVVTAIGLYRIIRVNNFKFRITAKDDYINSPKTFSINAPVYLRPANVAVPDDGACTILITNAPTGEGGIEEKYYEAIKKSDVGSYLYLKYMLDNGMAFYCLTIEGVDFSGNRPTQIRAKLYPKFCINCLKEVPESQALGNFKFPESLSTVNWSVGAFTNERGHPEAATLYERRLFLASNREFPTGIWGSSLQFDNSLDFTPDNTSSSAMQIKMGSQYTNKILWMVGQSRIFIGTAGGIFLLGSPDDKFQMSSANVSVRLFDAVSSSGLPAITGGDSVFFVDSSEKNVHEIILSSETGQYKANDISLLANELTTSGIVSHCWTQHPIKTYWCVTKDGHLGALTYLKNNGILAWSKHVLGGGVSAKAECVSAMKHEGEDHLWLCVNRTDTAGKDSRQIEYMSHSYNSRDIEDHQHYLDSGMTKSDETEIVEINTSKHTVAKGDFRAAQNLNYKNKRIVFEVNATNADNIFNKNTAFFLKDPNRGSAVLLRDFADENDTYINSKPLSSYDRGMIDPSTFGNTQDKDVARAYYYEIAELQDFSLNGELFNTIAGDSVDYILVGDKLIITALENGGLEAFSTIRDFNASIVYPELTVRQIYAESKTIRVTFTGDNTPLTGELKKGRLYKRSQTTASGYTLGEETSVICKGRGGTPWLQTIMPATSKSNKVITRLWDCVCYGGDKFIALERRSMDGIYSSDGVEWSYMSMPSDRVWSSACYGNGKFVAVAIESNKGAYSSDGLDWKEMNLPSTRNWCSVCYGDGKFVAVASGSLDIGTMIWSSDGINWGVINNTYGRVVNPDSGAIWYYGIKANLYSVCYGGGRFVAAGDIVRNGVSGKHVIYCPSDYVANYIEWYIADSILTHSVCYGDGRFVAVKNNSNLGAYSSDGITWTQLTLPSSRSWQTVCYGDGKYVAVALESNKGAYSSNGINWTEMDVNVVPFNIAVCYGNGKFVAMASDINRDDGRKYIIGTCSSDGVTWVPVVIVNLRAEQVWRSVCYGTPTGNPAGIYVAVAEGHIDNLGGYSYDGITWKPSFVIPSLDSCNWNSVCYGDGKFVAVSDNLDRTKSIAHSFDGINWLPSISTLITGDYHSVCYGGDKFVALASYQAGGAYSYDGIDWKEMSLLPPYNFRYSVCYGDGKFVAVSHYDKGIYSLDGIDWTEMDLPSLAIGSWDRAGSWYSVCYGNGRFVAVAGTSDRINNKLGGCDKGAYSPDGITWTEMTLPASTDWSSVCYGDGKFVAVSFNRAVSAFSSDGITWTEMDAPNAMETSASVCYSNGKFVVAGKEIGHFAYLNTIKEIAEAEVIQLDSVPNMDDICNKDYIVKSVTEKDNKYIFKLYSHWSVRDEPQPLDTCEYTDYEAIGANDARMLHYFYSVEGLKRFEGQEVTAIANGVTFRRTVIDGIIQLGEDEQHLVKALYCSVGIQYEARLKTVPLSGGNVTGSSVGCVGSQRTMVLHLFESWGGTYGTSAGEHRPIPYPKDVTAYDRAEGLFTGTLKCPVINGDTTNRCVYIYHNEPTAFSLISMVQDVQVSDA